MEHYDRVEEENHHKFKEEKKKKEISQILIMSEPVK
jgi:hypothetical protein